MRYTFTLLLLLLNIFLLSAQYVVYPFTDQNNKWGIIDNNKRIVLQPVLVKRLKETPLMPILMKGKYT